MSIGYSGASSTTAHTPVSEPQPSRPAKHGGRGNEQRGLLERVLEFLHPGPDSTSELIENFAEAEERDLIAPESRQMLEGVLRMAELSAGDVMVAAPRMDLLDIQWAPDDLLANVIDTGHSRFPVYDGQRDNIIGILLAKDLLKLQRAPELNLRALLRPAVFVPESKGLNELLRDVAAVNESFGLSLSVADFDTIGGLVAHEHGRVPRRGETVEVAGLRFSVMINRGGAVRWFKVTRAPASEADDHSG